MDREYCNLEKINTSKDLALIIKKNFLVIIKISASWCGPCKDKIFLESYRNLKSTYEMNELELESKQKIESKTYGIKFVELDVDRDADILDNKKYYDIDVEAVPTFLISKNGAFTRKYEGCGNIDKITEYIENATKLQV